MAQTIIETKKVNITCTWCNLSDEYFYKPAFFKCPYCGNNSFREQYDVTIPHHL